MYLQVKRNICKRLQGDPLAACRKYCRRVLCLNTTLLTANLGLPPHARRKPRGNAEYPQVCVSGIRVVKTANPKARGLTPTTWRWVISLSLNMSEWSLVSFAHLKFTVR